jgi:hypothetical protein
MIERDPGAPPAWAFGPIRDALGAQGELRSDPVLGAHVHLRLPHAIAIDCYPDTGLIHLTTPDSHLALAHQDPPEIDDRGIVFSQAGTGLSTDLVIDRTGAVTFLLTPAGLDLPSGAPEQPPDALIPRNRPDAQDTTPSPLQDDSDASQTRSDTPSGPSSSESGERPRVTLVGRLGAAPHFRTTRNEKLVGRFPLAVHHDDDSTTWHPIVVFGERAQQLRADALTKGDLISVIGYAHERTWTDRQGHQRTEVQIYAAVIARR